MAEPAERAPVALALVHHANQLIITDGYENRQGITEIAAGYAELLDLHRRYDVPCSLHLSGTLVESLAWHQPGLLDEIRSLVASGLVRLVGGTYAEHIMTLFPADVNCWHLEELFRLYDELLGCPPADLGVFWVPERVWDTELLAPVITHAELPNGGYRWVLLDDRLAFPAGAAYRGSPRAAFDATGPFWPGRRRTAPHGIPATELAEARQPARIGNGGGLGFVPIAANARYWIPPRRPAHLRRLEEEAGALATLGTDTLLVYADDMERTAGVGGWEPGLRQYETFLQWLTGHRELVQPVQLETWLEAHPPARERPVDPGTFFELAHGWQAGETYQGWHDHPEWRPWRRHLERADELLPRDDVPEEGLRALARKHFLASTHETAWQDQVEQGEGRHPAMWVRAVASHVRACHPIFDSARFFDPPEPDPIAAEWDVDGDGEQELVVAHGDLYAVLAPRHGGRLTFLAQRSAGGGVLSVGNPTDHWNFQTALNRYMDVPANHPGALSDVGHEHDRWTVTATDANNRFATASMTNTAVRSPLRGAHKRVLVLKGAPAVVVCWELPPEVTGLATEACLSPDYLRLLRQGRRALRRCGGSHWTGLAAGDTSVWLARPSDEHSRWAGPAHAVVGHGVNFRLQASQRHFHILLGCGPTDDVLCGFLLDEGRRLLHEHQPAGRL